MIRLSEKKKGRHLQQIAFHNLSFVKKVLAVAVNKMPKKHSRIIHCKVNEFINQPLHDHAKYVLRLTLRISALYKLKCGL